MFVTFVLRALGYTDSGDSPDFSYSGSVSFAAEIGLTSDGLLSDAGFTRGDVAVISKNALSQQMRFTGQTLYQYLADAGIIPPQEDKTTPDEKRQRLTGMTTGLSLQCLLSLMHTEAK